LQHPLKPIQPPCRFTQYFTPEHHNIQPLYDAEDQNEMTVCYPHHSVLQYLQLTPIYLATFVHYIVYTKNTH